MSNESNLICERKRADDDAKYFKAHPAEFLNRCTNYAALFGSMNFVKTGKCDNLDTSLKYKNSLKTCFNCGSKAHHILNCSIQCILCLSRPKCDMKLVNVVHSACQCPMYGNHGFLSQKKVAKASKIKESQAVARSKEILVDTQ